MWLNKVAKSDRERIQTNIYRLENLKQRVHDLGYFVFASQSGGYQVLKQMLNEKLVLGREKVHNKLSSALIGENNSKIALDSPASFQKVMNEAELLISDEINKEKRALHELDSD